MPSEIRFFFRKSCSKSFSVEIFLDNRRFFSRVARSFLRCSLILWTAIRKQCSALRGVEKSLHSPTLEGRQIFLRLCDMGVLGPLPVTLSTISSFSFSGISTAVDVSSRLSDISFECSDATSTETGVVSGCSLEFYAITDRSLRQMLQNEMIVLRFQNSINLIVPCNSINDKYILDFFSTI